MPSTPTVRTAVVDAAGHRLRADAAGSYLRMLAAGMPAGGVVVFSRTMAEQQRLDDLYRPGKGPEAAGRRPAGAGRPGGGPPVAVLAAQRRPGDRPPHPHRRPVRPVRGAPVAVRGGRRLPSAAGR